MASQQGFCSMQLRTDDVWNFCLKSAFQSCGQLCGILVEVSVLKTYITYCVQEE
jgi:hypothetical protein